MAHIAFVVVVLLKVQISYANNYGFGNIVAHLNDYTGDLLPKVTELTEGIQSIELPLVTDSFGKIGTVAVPFNTVCNIPGVYDFVSCYVCNQDCIVTHNQYGGKCAPNPHKLKEISCVCATSKEEATSRNIHISSRETCKKYLPKLPASIAAIDDALVGILLRNRLAAVLCTKYTNGTYNHSGCASDCRNNHGVRKGGYCADTISKQARFGTATARHCECFYPSKG